MVGIISINHGAAKDNVPLDYEGVSLTSRDANSKSAASEATNIFQSHYPEMLVSGILAELVSLLTIRFSTRNSSSMSPQF